MMPPPRVAWILAPLAGALLASCGTGPTAGAPPTVTLAPLDISSYAAVPCRLLRDDRAQRRHLATPGSVSAGADGPLCRWQPAAPGVPAYSAGVALHAGLDDVARHRADFSLLERTEIAHYPALHSRGREPGSGARCTTRVGVAPDSQVLVTADDTANPAARDSCGDADVLATEILGQLLASGG